MNKVILKYWIFNLLTGIFLYVTYRITMMDTTNNEMGLLATILHILEIILNLGFSLIYLTAMILCSFSVFLNNAGQIRNNYLLSWLSFSGAPTLLTVLLIISLLVNSYHWSGNVITKFLIFSVSYISLTTISFLRFRKLITESNRGIG